MNTGGLDLNGTDARGLIVSVDTDVALGTVSDSYFNNGDLTVSADGTRITNVRVANADVTINASYCQVQIWLTNADSSMTVTGDENELYGRIEGAAEHGLIIDGGSRNRVTMHVQNSGDSADDTYDNIHITGASDRNLITDCVLIPRTAGNQTRYGINIGGTGECNMVVGNDLGDPDDYGTDALVDTASNTQLFYPNDATYGDNFSDCGSGS